MASSEPLFIHKETRLSFEPPSSSLTVDIKLPAVASQGRNQRKVNGSSSGAADDDSVFRAKHCAKASSVYHRKHHSSPKGFLWRVLEEDTVLSIRSIDICRTKKASDANLVLNLRFPQPLRTSCIAFSDPSDHDTLSVFALDQTNHLYTISLKPEYFRKRSLTESGLADVCKIYLSSAFSFKHPHRLVAINDDQLIATLHDGGNIKFDRNKTHDGSHNPWKETFYNAKGWAQGFKSLLKGGHTVKYGKVNMELTAATGLAHTDLGLNDVSLLFTVCLDHRLRAWNLINGQIMDAKDLLNAERNPQEIGKWTIDPSEQNLIRISGETEGKRICATYSPVGAGEFKFWKLEIEGNNDLEITDLFPNSQLTPSPPSGSDVWTLADFGISERTPRGLELWIMWKNNMTHRVQRLAFAPEDIDEAWEAGWTEVYGSNTLGATQSSGMCDPSDPTEKWLQLILYPGRFTHATVETALRIYEKGLGVARDNSKTNKSLAEQLCAAITSTLTLERATSGGMDYDQYRTASEMQWRRFYRLLVELDKQRGEALSLVYAQGADLPWVVCADSISAIRDCSSLEQVCHNPNARHEGLEYVPALITAGLNFVDVFSDSMVEICQSVLRSELYEESDKTDMERIQYFSDKAAFWRQTSDEDCAQVTDALGQNFKQVTFDLYRQTLGLINAPEQTQEDMQYPLSEFGRKLIVKATQDTAELEWNVCFSQLILLVHMEFEFDQPEDALHSRLDIGAIYRHLINSLQRLELIRWLGKTQISVPVSKTERSGSFSGSPVATKRSNEDWQVITALEGNLGHLFGIASGENVSTRITNIATDLCADDSYIELQAHMIQCALLVQNRPDLALELNPFSERDPFPTYVQGRIYLALKDYSTAATYFKKAAYGLSLTVKHPSRHSAGLLDDTEWNLFNAGLPKYYAHVVALYDQQKVYSYSAEFARLSIQFITAQTKDAAEIRTEMQSRLFTAATAISQFDVAHATLASMSDNAIQHSSLRVLIQKMCDNLHNAELVELPFPGLQNAVDEILAQKCHATVDVITGVPYHQILYSWRIKRNDYRGAAAILFDRIYKLRQLGEDDQLGGDDILDTAITRQYLMLINVLSCVDEKQAWVTTEEVPTNGAQTNGQGSGKRKVMTLADIRREYQDELDRIAAIQNNQFGFAADDEMDVL